MENKLQMVNDAQTHSLPVERAGIGRMRPPAGLFTTTNSAPPEQFLRDYQRHTGQVNRIFEEIFGATEPSCFPQSAC